MLNEENDELDELENDIYFKESAKDLMDKVKNDPYKPGSKFGPALPEDVDEMVEHLIYLENYKELTLKISKAPDNYHIVIEIVSRVK